MSWIELHDSSRDHPKIKRLARDCHVTVAHALGLMCSLWTWALRMSPDGNLSSFEDEDIEDGAGWDGDPGVFIVSAHKHRLLDEIESGKYELHDWGDYASRLKARVRKRDERARKKRDCHVTPNSKCDCHADRPTEPKDQTDQTEQKDVKVKSESEDVRRVFSFWVETFWDGRGPEPKLDSNRRNKIAGRLKDGFSVEDLCNAIRGCKGSAWHMGENKQGKRYNSIDLIFRNREKTESFIAMHLNPQPGKRTGMAQPVNPEDWTEEDLRDDSDRLGI